MTARSFAASSSLRSRTDRSWSVSFGSNSPTSTLASNTTSRIVVQRSTVFHCVPAKLNGPFQLPQLGPWNGPETSRLSRGCNDKLLFFGRESGELLSQRTELLRNRDTVSHHVTTLAPVSGASEEKSKSDLSVAAFALARSRCRARHRTLQPCSYTHRGSNSLEFDGIRRVGASHLRNMAISPHLKPELDHPSHLQEQGNPTTSTPSHLIYAR